MIAPDHMPPQRSRCFLEKSRFADPIAPSSGIGAGFTLIEMLVSIAVLVLLVVLVAQLTNGATQTITGSTKHMDADGQARAILDRLAIDIGRMVKRSDADCIIKGWYADNPAISGTMPGNDSLFFFSETPGYYSGSSYADKSPITLVGYRVSPIGISAYALERLGQALRWEVGSDAGSIAFLTYAPGSSTPVSQSSIGTRWATAVGNISNNYTDGTSPDYQAIGEQVFRFEYCYLLKNGAFSNVPFIAPHTSLQGFQDVSAIVVAMGILDTNSRKITADLSQLTGALFDVSDVDLSKSPPMLMAEKWKNAVNDPHFASTAGIPQSAAGQVRVYQRFFYLNNK